MTDFKKISDVCFEIPPSGQMRVPARIFATEKLLESIKSDRSLTQLTNMASLPGIAGQALLMPDAHEGYGFPIGGVAATALPDGAISPGGIGYDINCGVRLLTSGVTVDDIKDKLDRLADGLFRTIPSGTGQGGKLKLSIPEIDQVLRYGAKRIIDMGYGNREDILNIEENGVLNTAEPEKVSQLAKERGQDQLGTLGAGNHFCEVDLVEEIFDEHAANAFGLKKNGIVVMIHTGSRGLGHQIATDYIRQFLSHQQDFGYSLPDRELAAAPFSSQDGRDYYAAMSAGANFAWANRQMLTHLVRKTWDWYLSGTGGKLKVLYDVAHNMAKLEEHRIHDQALHCLVHRKGATRAFPPGHPDLPDQYKDTGQPVFIPGSMGTASYVLAGSSEGSISLFTTCHGAGREMSRHEAMDKVQGKTLLKELKEKGIIVRAGSTSGAAEEAPIAYKDIDEVVDVVVRAGIAKKVARLTPLVVIKG